jgi:hypothetical protein
MASFRSRRYTPYLHCVTLCVVLVLTTAKYDELNRAEMFTAVNIFVSLNLFMNLNVFINHHYASFARIEEKRGVCVIRSVDGVRVSPTP